MRLKRFAVFDLFGLFDHSVELHLEDRITIIHAPNGYGKTVLLKMISSFYSGSMHIFGSVEYSSIVFEFDNGGVATIKSRNVDGVDESRPIRVYSFTYSIDGREETWAPFEDRDVNSIRRHVVPSMFERHIPELTRIAATRWRDHLLGAVLDFDEVVERYSDRLPASARRISPIPDWLKELQGAQQCQFIETQRLLSRKPSTRASDRDEADFTPAVETYSRDLAAIIRRTLAESTPISQSLDETFPSRILVRMRDTSAPLPEQELRTRLDLLELKRSRLARADLLEKSGGGALIPEKTLDETERKILTEYVGDSERKLSQYDDLLSRVELFVELLNGRFNFKSIRSDRRDGFVVEDIRGRRLNVSSLSSGEQHELVLFYDLIFRTRPDSLILIDEPEISLHIAWQKTFLEDLRKIISLSPIDVILATHSPQLIAGNLDLAVQLEARKGGRS